MTTEPKNTENNGRFKKGNTGKPKGATSKFTSLKNSFLEAFNSDRMKGTDGLITWAMQNSRNRGIFYQMVAKMLPSNIAFDGESDFKLTIERKTITDKTESKD